ncbi:MAG TPA: hypothetical protein PLF26_13270 [Blastocatellia bacterium]|nr:hypothetical protein [Blastocatellia bacterium]
MTDHFDDTKPLPVAAAAQAQRPDPELTGLVMQFDLDDEIRKLHHETAWSQKGRNAKTLVKHSDFRIVLTAMRAGTRQETHKADARVSIECVAGHLRLVLPDRTVDLHPRHVLVLDKCVEHNVEAVVDSALLVSISWPHGD